MDVDKSISSALGIDYESANTNVEIIPPEKPAQQQVLDVTSDAKEDFAFARATIKELVGNGLEQLKKAGELAEQIDKPSAFEAYANLLDKINTATQSLYDLHKKQKDLVSPAGRGGVDDSNISIDKAVFVGTTAEMLKKIKERKKQQQE